MPGRVREDKTRGEKDNTSEKEEAKRKAAESLETVRWRSTAFILHV